MENIRLFGLASCGSCKKAKKHLAEKGLDFEFVDIRESPPNSKLISSSIKSGVERKRLLNTSGGQYRSGNYKEQLPKLSDTDFAEELAGNPMLIKRPFLVRDKTFVVGYRADEYNKL